MEPKPQCGTLACDARWMSHPLQPFARPWASLRSKNVFCPLREYLRDICISIIPTKAHPLFDYYLLGFFVGPQRHLVVIDYYLLGLFRWPSTPLRSSAFKGADRSVHQWHPGYRQQKLFGFDNCSFRLIIVSCISECLDVW